MNIITDSVEKDTPNIDTSKLAIDMGASIYNRLHGFKWGIGFLLLIMPLVGGAVVLGQSLDINIILRLLIGVFYMAITIYSTFYYISIPVKYGRRFAQKYDVVIVPKEPKRSESS